MRQKRTGKRTDGAESESSVNRLRLIVSVNGRYPEDRRFQLAEEFRGAVVFQAIPDTWGNQSTIMMMVVSTSVRVPIR